MLIVNIVIGVHRCSHFLKMKNLWKPFKWWAREDSNLRPMDYESTALTNYYYSVKLKPTRAVELLKFQPYSIIVR